MGPEIVIPLLLALAAGGTVAGAILLLSAWPGRHDS